MKPVQRIIWCCPACGGIIDQNATACIHCTTRFSNAWGPWETRYTKDHRNNLVLRSYVRSKESYNHHKVEYRRMYQPIRDWTHNNIIRFGTTFIVNAAKCSDKRINY
jgi:hypothetical protein